MYASRMWSILEIIIMLCLISAVESFISESKVVKIEQGLLRGYRHEERDYFAFMSVPYATAPPGRDRFKAPLPPPVWMQTFDAIETGVVCPQSFFWPKVQEDCLLANIFVPDTNDTNLPVMVYVHGGAFSITSGDYFRYTVLVGFKRSIVVTFNYRLGAHGFLCLGTKNAPGNAGMKDQVALLRWVKRNIASFGGNPNDVTLVGCRAGASAIDLLSLSPMSKDLFHKVILEGGASVGVSEVQMNPVENAKTYAKLLNFTDVDNMEALEEFYLTATYECLTLHTKDTYNREDSTTLFSPCIERDTGSGEEMFLTDTPRNIILKGQYNRIPMMFGYTELEASDRAEYLEEYSEMMNKDFSKFLPGDLEFESEEQRQDVARRVKQFYFGDKKIGEHTVLEFFSYFSDILAVFPILRSLVLRWQSGNETVYLYEYSFVDVTSDVIPYTNLLRSGHCGVLSAIIDQDHIYKTKEYMVMGTLVKDIWLNFIATGQPIPQGSSLPAWPPSDSGWSPYMAFDNVTLELRTSLSMENRANFWVPIYRKHYRDPLPPINSATTFRSMILLGHIILILITQLVFNVSR